MFNSKNLLPVLTSLEAIEKILLYTKNCVSAEDFYNQEEQKTFNAVITLMAVIGEEVKKTEARLLEKHTDIDWKGYAGLRDRLVHAYRGIDPDMCWHVVHTDLTSLKTVLVKMIGDISYDKDMLYEALQSDYYRHIRYLSDVYLTKGDNS